MRLASSCCGIQVIADMTAYIANHLKKNRILEKRKQELGHAIINDHNPEKIQRAAEKLRYAQLNVFKCDYAKRTVRPIHHYTPDEEAQQWERYSVEEIIEKYLSENPIDSKVLYIERACDLVLGIPSDLTAHDLMIEKYEEGTTSSFNAMTFKERVVNDSGSPNEETSD